MAWFVYALCSERDKSLYIGMTSDVTRRVEEHNRGYNRSTKSRGPFRLIYIEGCDSRSAARQREKRLKTGSGREMLRQFARAG